MVESQIMYKDPIIGLHNLPLRETSLPVMGFLYTYEKSITKHIYDRFFSKNNKAIFKNNSYPSSGFFSWDNNLSYFFSNMTSPETTKGFIPIIPLIIASVAILVAGGTGYGIHHYQQTQKESEDTSLVEKLEIVRELEDRESDAHHSPEDRVESTDTTSQETESNIGLNNLSEGTVDIATNHIQPTINYLSDSEKEAIAQSTKTILAEMEEFVDILEKWSKKYDKSDYKSEYFDVIRLINETTKYFEERVYLGKLILKAVQSDKNVDAEKVGNAFLLYKEITLGSSDFIKILFENISSLEETTNKIVENLIKLEVIDELSQQYGVSGYTSGSTETSNYYELSKQADDYVKSLSEKNKELQDGYGKTIKNYLIGIVIFY